MQINAGLQLLTTAEAVDYIPIEERKLHELWPRARYGPEVPGAGSIRWAA